MMKILNFLIGKSGSDQDAGHETATAQVGPSKEELYLSVKEALSSVAMKVSLVASMQDEARHQRSVETFSRIALVNELSGKLGEIARQYLEEKSLDSSVDLETICTNAAGSIATMALEASPSLNLGQYGLNQVVTDYMNSCDEQKKAMVFGLAEAMGLEQGWDQWMPTNEQSPPPAYLIKKLLMLMNQNVECSYEQFLKSCQADNLKARELFLRL